MDIKQHLQGYAATLAALDLIRRGVDPAEATARLLIDLAGKDCLAAFSDKELRSLANKMSHAALNMAKAVHATHAVFGEALENGDVIQPALRTPSTKKNSPARNAYQRDLMRKRRAKERAERCKANAPTPISHFDGVADGMGAT